MTEVNINMFWCYDLKVTHCKRDLIRLRVTAIQNDVEPADPR